MSYFSPSKLKVGGRRLAKVLVRGATSVTQTRHRCPAHNPDGTAVNGSSRGRGSAKRSSGSSSWFTRFRSSNECFDRRENSCPCRQVRWENVPMFHVTHKRLYSSSPVTTRSSDRRVRSLLAREPPAQLRRSRRRGIVAFAVFHPHTYRPRERPSEPQPASDPADASVLPRRAWRGAGFSACVLNGRTCPGLSSEASSARALWPAFLHPRFPFTFF